MYTPASNLSDSYIDTLRSSTKVFTIGVLQNIVPSNHLSANYQSNCFEHTTIRLNRQIHAFQCTSLFSSQNCKKIKLPANKAVFSKTVMTNLHPIAQRQMIMRMEPLLRCTDENLHPRIFSNIYFLRDSVKELKPYATITRNQVPQLCKFILFNRYPINLNEELKNEHSLI